MKALVLASVASMIKQFNMNNIEILQDLGYSVDVVANYKYGSTITTEMCKDNKIELEENGVNVYHVNIPRNPAKFIELIKSYKQIKEIINTTSYDLIHCHSPIGGFLTRFAARKTRKKNNTKVIYTAHGFHFCKGTPIKNWVLYYPVEWLCSFMTDALITINKEDYKRAKKYFHAKEVCYVHGVGIDTEKFANVKVDIDKKRKELGLDIDDIMLLSVGELSKRKNHEIIIKALAKINNANIHYFIAGTGNLNNYLIDLSEKLGIKDNVHLLGYRSDVAEMYKTADIFCFPSLWEGLGLAALEAMIAGTPIITSNIHGIKDYSVNNKTGFAIPPRNIDMWAESIKELLENKNMRTTMGEYCKKCVSIYDNKNALSEVEQIYKKII